MTDKTPQEKYLFKPFYGSSHCWALNSLEPLPKNLKVLDIGSGSGGIGRRLIEFGFQELYAVEIDERAREHVKDIYKEVSPDLSRYKGQQFDRILLLDVLEHLPDPKSFLQSAQELLAPGGRFLISVPNIAHWSIRASLLFGFFESADRGILDRTHLQFFTRNKFHRLVESTGLKIVESAASIPPVEFLIPSWVSDSAVFKALSKIHFGAAQIFPTLFGYQSLVVAEGGSNQAYAQKVAPAARPD